MTVTKVLRLNDDAILPHYSYPGDAGMDLSVVGHHTLNPGESRDLPIGIAVELPSGYWGRITGRSSSLRKRGLFVNEGVIDEGYRGELYAYVSNRNGLPVEVQPGERLAQLIIQPVYQAPAEWSESLSESERGARGFGSTGHHGKPEPAQDPEDRRFRLYLGGPIDYTVDGHDWRHHGWDEFEVLCPVCMNQAANKSDREILKTNDTALRTAEVAILLLDGFSVGTPVEAYLRVGTGKPTVLVHPQPQGVFVRYWSSLPHVHVASSLDDARYFAREMMLALA